MQKTHGQISQLLLQARDTDISHHPDQKDDGACNTAKLPHNIDEKMNQSPY